MNTTKPTANEAAMLAATECLDNLVQRHTAFHTLADMMTAPGNYRPTIPSKSGKAGRELDLIADAYDMGQRLVGDSRRAFRS